MPTNPRPSQSEKYKTLVIATLDYLIEHCTGHFVQDGFDIEKVIYEEQKVKAENYRKKGQLRKLQQQLEKFVQVPQSKLDLKFNDYLKQRTGYDHDIFADLLKFGDELLLTGEVQDWRQLPKLWNLRQLLKMTNKDQEKLDRLNVIAMNFHQHRSAQERNQGTSRVIKTEEKDGIITETIEVSFGPKPKHSESREIPSPDGERMLFIDSHLSRNGVNSLTNVSLSMKNGSGGIYAATGVHPKINAFWKDNNTVVIETGKASRVLAKHHLIQSLGDTVNIEYIELDQ